MEVRGLKAEQMLVLTNMISKILSEVDDLKAMIKEVAQKNFEQNFEEEE